MTTRDTPAIEVEVVEIDGIAPRAQAEAAPESGTRPPWQDWQKWQGRLLKLDRRWWPLWVVLGSIVFVLLLTVGLVLGVLFLIFRIVSGFVRALFR